jgi:hypothetical protein
MPDRFSGIASRVVDDPQWVAEWIESVPADMPRAIAWVLLAVAASDAARDIAEAAPAFAAFVARQDAEPPDSGGDSAVSSIDTQFGGVFYLLPVVNELTLGEILWRACLPEGHVVARAVGALIHQSEAEPALRTLHGPGHAVADLAVSDAQQAEASVALCEAFTWALPRRTGGALPEPIVRIHDLSVGRMLIVSARQSPHIFFAAPARTPAEIVSALESFLGIWPRSAPAPRADRALAALDRRARIAPLTEREPPSELLIVDDGSLFASALPTQIAGTLGHLFSARLEADPNAIVRDYLEVPARLVSDRSTLTVQIPMDRINLMIRRAGLDADPGWVPWLERRVAFEYVEGSASARET